jgi:phenylalanyl-tRNA synthetase alpha chain
MLQKIIEEMHLYEKKVLKALESSGGEVTPQKVAKTQDLNVKQVMSAAGALESKGIIKVQKEIDQIVKLTEEGNKYAKNDLYPDRWITHKTYINSATPVNDIPTQYKPAIGSLRKKDLIYIENGKIKLTDSGIAKHESLYDKVGKKDKKKFFDEEEEFLKFILEKQSCSISNIPENLKKAVKNLKHRKIIKITNKPSYQFKITSKGQQILDHGFKIREEATQVTHEQLKTGSWRELHYRGYDINAEFPEIFPGKMHPLQRNIQEIRRIFLNMGFTESSGTILESAFWNFDCLFQPQDHAAREMQDTFYVKSPETTDLPPDDLVEKVGHAHVNGGGTGSEGWGYQWDVNVARQSLLRTHTTCVSARFLAEKKPPLKMFSVGRVFRRETVTYKHLPEFHQVEGIVAAEGINFRNLLGILKEFYHQLGFEVRFRPAYFPYTYLSTECEVYLPEKESWIELGGAGMFRPEVLEPLSVETPVAAFGLGIERLAMIRLGIKDIRMLYQSNLGWLRKLPIIEP